MHYKKAINTYAIVQPLILVVLLIVIAAGAALYVRSKLGAKEEAYAEYKSLQGQARMLRKSSAPRLNEVRRWTSLMEADTREILNAEYNKAFSRSTDPRLRRQENAISNRPGPLAAVLDDQATRSFEIAYRGTFRDIQTMFLNFEYRLPNLTLDRMLVEPAPGSSTEILVRINLTSWQP